MAGALGFAWVLVNNIFGLFLFTAGFGFFSGAIASLSLSLTVALSPDPALLGVCLGMLLIPCALGLLLGKPIAGAVDSGSWLKLQIFTGAVLIGATVLVIWVRLLIYGGTWGRKC
jgi:hypothetical protein